MSAEQKCQKEKKVEALQFLISIGDYEGITDGFRKITTERDNALAKCAELEAGLVKLDRLCVELYTAIYWLNEALAAQPKAEGGQP